VIADVLGTGRSAAEVATFVKEKLAAAPMKEGDDFQNFLAARKGTGEVVAEGGASTRETAFSDVVLAEGWTEAQDLALLGAMKANPKSAGGDEKARWLAIAAAVPGKAAAACVKRVAQLKELRSKS